MSGSAGRSLPPGILVPVLVLAAAGVLAWLGLGALGVKQTEAEALADRMGNPALATLLTDPAALTRAIRDAAELEKMENELERQEAKWTDVWVGETQRLAGQGEDWSQDPGKWKDRLILVQSELQKNALVRRVSLGPDFYLGLEAYREKSPAPEEVPGLALHLGVAQRLVERLLEARQVNEQYPTVCELRMLSGPGSVTEKGSEAPVPAAPPKKGEAGGGPPRKKFRLEIRCSPEVLYEYVRRLLTDPSLLIITGLAVTNEQQAFPLRSEIAKKFSESGASPEASPEASPDAKKAEKKLLEILAGKESISALLEVDFVAWAKPAETGPGEKPPKAKP